MTDAPGPGPDGPAAGDGREAFPDSGAPADSERPGEGDGSTLGAPSGSGRSFLRMVLYYAALIGAIALLAVFFPAIEGALGRLNQISRDFSDEITQTFTGSPPTANLDFDRYGVILGAVSILGALGIMVPVAWTYIVIKRPGDYDQSVVHTLLILPMVVTGIVLVVQNSVALAFSLAGIVAAVRFRTTLKDTKDAVYVFLAIGVGIACGVLALGLALVLSLAFNVINLILWRLNFGNIYADQTGRTRALALGDVLAGPGSGAKALSIGDRRLVDAMSTRELKEVAERVARMDRYLDAEAEEPRDRKQFSVLMVYVDKAAAGQQVAERHLARLAVRWRLAEILPGKGGVQILEYLVRLKEGVSPGLLLDALREEGSGAIRAAELRSLEGLKKG